MRALWCRRSFLALFLAFISPLFYGCGVIQRKLLFYPTHRDQKSGLTEWRHEGGLIGYSRPVSDPENVWLLLHGNGGQASDRVYALPAFSSQDSVFVLEYPGYGSRPGKPSKGAFDGAAVEAYRLLRSM